MNKETPTPTQTLPDNLGVREPERFLHDPEHERGGKNEMQE